MDPIVAVAREGGRRFLPKGFPTGSSSQPPCNCAPCLLGHHGDEQLRGPNSHQQCHAHCWCIAGWYCESAWSFSPSGVFRQVATAMRSRAPGIFGLCLIWLLVSLSGVPGRASRSGGKRELLTHGSDEKTIIIGTSQSLSGPGIDTEDVLKG